MERHCSNAQALAKFLEKHPKVKAVNFPGLAKNKFNAIAKKHLNDGDLRIKKLNERNNQIKNNILFKIQNFSEEYILLKKIIYENTNDLELFSSGQKKYKFGIKLEKNYKFNSALKQFNLANLDIDNAYKINNKLEERKLNNFSKFIIIISSFIFILFIIQYLRK